MRTRMRTKALVAGCLAAVLAFALKPATKQLCEGFLPENDMKIPVGSVMAKGLNEASFNKVLDVVQRVYTPIVASKGGKLVVDRNWGDDTVNAYAYQTGGDWHIAMFGGLARHAVVTEFGFMLVACHELGHHLGGLPKRSWATNEGGSDYFGTLKCMRLVAPQMNWKAVDPVASRACAAAHEDEAEQKQCEDSAMAGLSLATLLQQIGGESKTPRFDTPDANRVSTTNDAHPAAQCRLDTYFQGSLCAKPVREDVSGSDPTAGACTAKGGFSTGIRPRCWYKPPADEPGGVMEAVIASRTTLNTKSIEGKIEALKLDLSRL
ncbi:MAG: hypothetical protein HY078_04030 [Elusimicrobia bacterium]|nr:hypothetical protein [Elusimicrobiota bacterium]